MNQILNISLFYLGGAAIGLATMIPLLLPYGDRYTGRGAMIVAALLHAFTVVGFVAPNARFLLLLIPFSSFLLILRPILRQSPNAILVRPVLPAVGLVVADFWTATAWVHTLDPAFMGGQC